MFHVERVDAHLKDVIIPAHSILEKLQYPDITIPNRSLAWSLHGKGEDSTEIKALKRKIDEYNAYIDSLANLKNFESALKENHYCLKKEAAELLWGAEITREIFDLHTYPFETPLRANGEWLFVPDVVPCYEAVVGQEKISFEVGATDSGYPSKSADESKLFLWNWMNDYRDLCFGLWELFDRLDWLPSVDDDDEPIKDYSGFECYDQYRYDMNGPDVNLWRCAQILMDTNYLKVYELHPEDENPWWNLRGTSEGTITVGVLDQAFLKNKVQKDKLKLVLNSSEDEVRAKKYILLDSHKKPYLSNKGAQYGGHYKLKIYGQLDCPSAARYIAKGQYVQQRVFFENEETAVAVGFRPCEVCMKKEYAHWKERNKETLFNR